MFYLVNTFDTIGDRYMGCIVSAHRSEEAAIAANVRLQRGVKRANGATSYLPTRIVERKARHFKGDFIS